MGRSLNVTFARAPLLVRIQGLHGADTKRSVGLLLDEARDLCARLGRAIAEGEQYMKDNPDARRPEDRVVATSEYAHD